MLVLSGYLVGASASLSSLHFNQILLIQPELLIEIFAIGKTFCAVPTGTNTYI